jgi:hypothetical protein
MAVFKGICEKNSGGGRFILLASALRNDIFRRRILAPELRCKVMRAKTFSRMSCPQ